MTTLAAIATKVDAALDSQNDRWARTVIAAAAIPDHVRLDDVAGVSLAIMGAGVRSKDFVDVLDNAIIHAAMGRFERGAIR